MQRHANSYNEIRKEVDMYFDNELTPTAQESFLKRVNLDPDYSRAFDREKNFRNFIKTNVRRPSVSPDFIQNIKNKIRIV
jgi:hypothetical protein